MMDTLRDCFRRRLSETLDDAGEMRLLTDGKGLFLRTKARPHLRPAGRSDAAVDHGRWIAAETSQRAGEKEEKSEVS